MKYKVSMNKDDFFKLHNKISCTDLVIDGMNASFLVELGSLTIIKESKLSYRIEESFVKRIKMLLTRYYLLIFGLLFLFSILYINTFRVSKIIFSVETPINDEIEATIKKSYKRLFMHDFTNLDFNKLSLELQKKYVEYPYIAVYSNNNNVMVDIYDELSSLKSNHISNGYLVAKKDSIIDSFYVYGGNLEVYKNKFVKKGDILISSGMQSGGAGLVLGYTYEKIEMKINKVEKCEEISSNTQSYFQIEAFNNSFNVSKKASFNEFSYSENIIFNLFDIFRIKKIEETEKSVIIKTYDLNEAIELGKNEIINAFNKAMVSNHERIIDILPYNTVDDKACYKITYIVKKLESIGEFVNMD